MKSDNLKFFQRHGGAGVMPLAAHASLIFLLLTFCVALFAVSVAAQDDLPEAMPPPLKVISKEEIAKLGAKKDIKDRTKLSLDLMDSRLTSAEKFGTARDFGNMYRELGVFHALMDDALNYLNKRDTGKSGKILDNLKRLEIGLRGMATRIAIIRRELPLRYDPYVRNLMGYLRSARAKATDSLFGDSVLPRAKPGN